MFHIGPSGVLHFSFQPLLHTFFIPSLKSPTTRHLSRVMPVERDEEPFEKTLSRVAMDTESITSAPSTCFVEHAITLKRSSKSRISQFHSPLFCSCESHFLSSSSSQILLPFLYSTPSLTIRFSPWTFFSFLNFLLLIFFSVFYFLSSFFIFFNFFSHLLCLSCRLVSLYLSLKLISHKALLLFLSVFVFSNPISLL